MSKCLNPPMMYSAYKTNAFNFNDINLWPPAYGRRHVHNERCLAPLGSVLLREFVYFSNRPPPDNRNTATYHFPSLYHASRKLQQITLLERPGSHFYRRTGSY